MRLMHARHCTLGRQISYFFFFYGNAIRRFRLIKSVTIDIVSQKLSLISDIKIETFYLHFFTDRSYSRTDLFAFAIDAVIL